MNSLPVVQDHHDTIKYLECAYFRVLNAFEGSIFIDKEMAARCAELSTAVYNRILEIARERHGDLQKSLEERDMAGSRANTKALNRINRQMMRLSKLWDGDILDEHTNIDDEEYEDEDRVIKQYPVVEKDVNWSCAAFLTNIQYAHAAVMKSRPTTPY